MRKGQAANQRNKELGKRVRNARLAREWGIVQLARKLGITHQALQQLETGQTSWSVDRLLAVSKALDISLTHLLEGLGSKNKDLGMLTLSEEEVGLILSYRSLSPQAQAAIKAGAAISKNK